jgi:hypothetical protein
MRALFDRVAVSLKTVQMRIGSRQDVFRHATDAMLAGTGSIGLGPTGMFESIFHASSSGALLKFGPKKVARCGRVSSGNNDETTSANACHGSDVTANTWYTPRRRRYNAL